MHTRKNKQLSDSVIQPANSSFLEIAGKHNYSLGPLEVVALSFSLGFTVNIVRLY